MSDQEGGEVNGTSEVDLAAAFIDVRKRIAGLGDTIDSLRVEADELRRRADGRTTLTMFEPAVSGDDVPGMAGGGESSLDSLGRHAANVPEEFDPSPFDPDEDEATIDASVGAFDNLAAAPGLEPGFGDHASLPPVDVAPGRATLNAPEPEAVLADDDRDVDDGKGADVIEFPPRTSQPDDGDVAAFGLEEPDTTPAAADPEHRTSSGPDVAPAFGDLATEASTDDAPAPSASHAKDADNDGLDAIAATGSTNVPEDWNGPGGDEEAFDKFFSNEVEPEPAQRWLLNE